MLGDIARSTANFMFMAIGIWMAHSLYRSDKEKWKIALAWWLAVLAAGVSATLLTQAIGTPALTHERISMFCGFSGILVYLYLFPVVPIFQRAFTYFFVDTSMYLLVVLSRYISVFLFGLFPAFSSDAWFLFCYVLFAALFVFFFATWLKKPMLHGLRVFYNQSNPLALFAFLCYVTIILLVDPWGPLYTVGVKEIVRVLSLCSLTACMYFIAFRTMEAINTTATRALETKMLRAQVVLSEHYYENMADSIEQTKAVRHDLNHHIRVMEAMCEDERWKELQAYMKSLQKGMTTAKLPIYCEDYVVNVLLGYYDGESRRRGINFDCVAQLSGSVVKDNLKLCIILGNGLQNALEACERMTDAGTLATDLHIRTRINVHRNNLVMEIKNSFDGTIHTDGEMLHTVKKEPDHGIGLSSIRSTAELYHGYCSTVFTEDEFTLSVLLNLENQPEAEA